MIMGALIAWIFFPIAFFISSICCAADSDYAYPRILIFGTTGVGKSSLSSVLAGCLPGDCLFPVCTSINSCTKNTSIVQAKFMGNFSGPDVSMKVGNVTIVDTPAFEGDSEEPKLLSEMVQVLKEDLKWANLIVLCFDGIRFDANTKAMLQTLDKLFGQNLWKNALIEVTKWSYNEQNIQDRKRRGITEEDTLLAINNQLKQKFNLNHSLPGVFLDSNSVHYPEDEVQTSFFRKYSSMLWETAQDRKPFSLEALGQVKDGRSSACGMDIDCCDFLTNEINAVKSSISDLIVTDNTFNDRLNDNTMKIVDNKLTIQTNEKHIETNTNNIDGNANKIDANTDKISTNTDKIATNTGHITTNTGHITTNTNAISGLTETTSRFVSYCGYKHGTGRTGTITYSRLATSVNSFSPTGGLSTSTGYFTAPTDGTYLITYNFYTYGSGYFSVNINYNGQYLDEGFIHSQSTDNDADMTGRTLTKQLKTDDKLYLHVTHNDGTIWRPTFCITLLH